MRIIVETVLLIILSIAIVAMAVVLVIVLSKNKNNNINDAIYDASKKLNQDTVNSVKLMSDMINQNQVNMAENQKFQLQQMENRLKTFSMENEQKLENIRSTVEKKLTYMQEDNNKQLENIRTTVDEKLQNTLENKLNKSFETVSKQLQQVYKGLGEMNDDQLGESALHPDSNRTLMRYTIEDVKAEIDAIRAIESDKSVLMKDIKVSKSDIS